MSVRFNALRRFLIDGSVFEQPLTGVAKATLGLYVGLLRNHSELDITIIHRRQLCGEIPSGIKTLQLSSAHPFLWRNVDLPLHVHSNKYDVIHFPWNKGIPANLPTKSLKVLTLHDILPLSIPNYFRHPLRKFEYTRAVNSSLRRANLTITDSNFSRQNILEEFTPKMDPVVIYPASPLRTPNDSTCNYPAFGNEPFFLFCGGYDKRKGIEVLLEAFIELWRHKSFSVPLWLAGDSHAYSARLVELLNEARELGAIKELGYVSDNELGVLYKNAIALIYPSRYEGFGLPPLEAMSFGCPVATYPLTSLPEVCGDAALYIDPEQDVSLSNLIVELSTNKPLRERLIKVGLQQSAKFTWDNSAQFFMDALESSAY